MFAHAVTFFALIGTCACMWPYQVCPPNEHLSNASMRCNRCEPSCDNPNPRVCTMMACLNDCECNAGLYRKGSDESSTCVELAACGHTNTCPENEHRTNASRRCNGCEPSCDNPNPRVCTLMACLNFCECNAGLYRKGSGESSKCVELAACEPTNTCPENEHRTDASRRCNGCEPSCDNPTPEICTEMYCSNVCECNDGLYRKGHGENSTCVELPACMP